MSIISLERLSSYLVRYYHVHNFSWEVVFFSSPVLPCPSFLLWDCLLILSGTTMSIISLDRLSSSLPRSYHVHHFSWYVVFFSCPVLPCPSFLLRGCLLLFPGTTMSIISLERLSSYLVRYYHVHHFSWEVVFFSSPALPCPSFLLRGCLLLFPGTTMSIISLERLSSSLPRYYHVHHFSWEVVFFSSPVLPCPSFLLRGCLLLFPGTTMSIISLLRGCLLLFSGTTMSIISLERLSSYLVRYYHVHHFSWEVVFFSSPVQPCPSFLLIGCLLLFPGTTMSIISHERLSSSLLRYYHVHHFSWGVVFFSSPVLPCPSLILIGCLLLFPGTTMSIISIERLSSSLPGYYHVHHFSW